MEEEIDLRPYMLILLKRWKLIVSVTVLAALVSLIVSSLLPKVYEATALVVVTKPTYNLRFDPRFEIIEQIQIAGQLYPELAQSDEVVDLLFETVGEELGISSPAALSEMLSSSVGKDPSLVRLTVRAQDPESAARIANVWAGLLVDHVNRLAGRETQVALLEGQLAQAAAELEAAEEARIEYEAQNRSNLLRNQLDSYKTMQSDYLRARREIAYIIQDIIGLQQRLRAQSPEDLAAPSDELTALLLQIKAFNAGSGAQLQFQIDSAAFSSERLIGEQVVLLDELVATLEEKSQEIDGRLAAIEPLLLETQRALEESEVEAARLERAVTIKEETYNTLARAAAEARIAAQSEEREIQLAAQAVPPERPVSPRLGLNTAVAGLLGFILSVFGVFATEWWRKG